MARIATVVLFLSAMTAPALVAQAKFPPLLAADVTKEFAADPEAAKKKYGLKQMVIDGVVESFPKKKEGGRDLVLKGHAADTGVFCADLPEASLDKLKVGDKVRIAGLGVDKVGPWFVMGQCRVATDSPFGPKPPAKPAAKPPVGPAAKDTAVRGKPAAGLVAPQAGRNWKVVGLVPKLAYISDRDDAILKFPKEMDGGHVVVRDSTQVNNWVQKGQLVLEKDATLYAAMLVRVNDQVKVTDKQLDAMAADGWEFLTEPFETTSPDKSWTWRVAKKSFPKGPLDPQLPKEFLFYVTHAIYVLK